MGWSRTGAVNEAVGWTFRLARGRAGAGIRVRMHELKRRGLRRKWIVGLWWLMGLGGVASGQVELHYESPLAEDEEKAYLVGGVLGGGPAYLDAGRLYPLPLGGEYLLKPAEALVERPLKAEYDYSISLPRPQPGAWVQYGQVEFRAVIEATKDISAGLYAVRAWIGADGSVSRVAVRGIGALVKYERSVWRDTITIRREEAGGRLWVGLFEDGKPVSAGEGDAALVDAWMRGLPAAGVAGQKPDAKWMKAHENIMVLPALHGDLAFVRAVWPWLESRKQAARESLIGAAGNGRIEVVRFLLDQGVDVDSQNSAKVRPLSRAIEGGHIEVARLLLQRGASVKDSPWGPSLLVSAIGQGDPEFVEVLKAEGARLPKGRDDLARLLVLGVYRRDAYLVRELLAVGARADALAALAFMPQASAIEAAAAVGDGDILELLLAAGADLEVRDAVGRWPLFSAVELNRSEAVSRLLAAGANPQARTKDGFNLLTVALRTGAFEVVPMLLEAGIRPENLEADGPLVWLRALLRKDPAALELAQRLEVPLPLVDAASQPVLIEALVTPGAEPVLDAAKKSGWTLGSPLLEHWTVRSVAAYYGRTEVWGETWDATGLRSESPPIGKPYGPRLAQRSSIQFPPEEALAGNSGKVSLVAWLSPEGRVLLPKVREATSPAFAEAARRGVAGWVFATDNNPDKVWLRFELPVVFSADDQMLGDDLPERLVDEMPVPEKIAAVALPEGVEPGSRAVADVSFIVKLDGRVSDVAVRLISDERWRANLMGAVRQWRFRPGIDENRAVNTIVRRTIIMPAAEFAADDGLAVEGVRSQFDQVPRWRTRRPVKMPDGFGAEQGIALVEIRVGSSGKPEAVMVVSTSHAQFGEATVKAFERSRFHPAVKNGEPVETILLMPVFLNR